MPSPTIVAGHVSNFSLVANDPNATRKVLSIIVPAHNEEGSIGAVVSEFYDRVVPRFPNSELIVVDDCSTDGTARVVGELAKTRPALRIISPERNVGHSASVRLGFAHAQGAWLFYTDGDFQTRADTLLLMLEDLEVFDYQSGFRPQRGDGFQREVVTRVLSLCVRLLTGAHVIDPNCPYKLMRRSLWLSLEPVIPEDSPAQMACLASIVPRVRVRTRYLPIEWHERRAGRASVSSWLKWVRLGWRVARDLRRLRHLIVLLADDRAFVRSMKGETS